MNDASLKKGTWSKEEDTILVEYVKKYGVGNWNAIEKRTELTRCGKSCRLRWNNHLKVGVKKGKFSEQEEQKVIRMKELGFKWCQMAQQLPGRSDNDIKNFWNARKRKQNRNPKLSGSSSLSNDPSNHDEMIKNNNSEQLPNLIDVPNKQLPTFPNLLVDDSNKQLPKIPRASIGTSFMHEARVPNLPTLPSSYLAFQNMDYPLRYDEINKNNSEQLPNLFNVPNKELPKWVDDSNMFYNNVGSASTSNFRGGYGTSSKQFTMVPNPLPPCSYIQNPLLPPKEAQYQRTGPVSLLNLSNFFTHFKKVMEDSHASRVRSSKVNLVDEKGKKPISFGANLFSNYTDSSRHLAGISLLDNDDNNNNLNDKLPHDVKDTLDGVINERGVHWDILPNFGSLDNNNNNNNNLNDKLPRDVKDRLDVATNERGIDWDILHNFGSLDNSNNNTLHLKLPDDVKDALVATINGKGIVPYHLPNVILSDNNDNNNLHDKIPHNIKDTLGAVIYGKSIHPK